MVVNKDWMLTLREECKLRVLRRIFGPKRDKVTNEWRKLHNVELNDLYSSPSTPYVSSPLTYIFNKILSTGIFPDRLKFSEVKPLYKAGDKTEFSIYRPISLLT